MKNCILLSSRCNIANMPKENIEKLTYYRHEMADRVLHEGLNKITERRENTYLANRIQEASKGNLYNYKYIKYDDYFKEEDYTLGKNIQNSNSNNSNEIKRKKRN